MRRYYEEVGLSLRTTCTTKLSDLASASAGWSEFCLRRRIMN
jgi:hypothetical protein